MNQPAATINFGIASQSLTFDCPEGVPSSITSVTIQDDDQADTGTTESATTGSPSIDSASTTLTAAAGPSQANPNLLTVSSVASFAVKRTYWLTSALGWREPVEVVGIDSTNKYLYLRTALQSDYASGDAIASPRISVTLSSTWVADTSKLSGARYDSTYSYLSYRERDQLSQLSPRPRWRAEWVYVVSGATYRAATYFDLVRYPLQVNAGVTAQDVDQLSRGWLYRLAAEDQGEADAVLREAMRQVKLDLWERDIAAYALRSGEVLAELVRRKAVALVHEQAAMHSSAAPELAKMSADLYYARLDALLGAQPKAQIQISPDGTGGLPEAAPLFRR